jgi:hypothetical protein
LSFAGVVLVLGSGICSTVLTGVSLVRWGPTRFRFSLERARVAAPEFSFHFVLAGARSDLVSFGFSVVCSRFVFFAAP